MYEGVLKPSRSFLDLLANEDGVARQNMNMESPEEGFSPRQFWVLTSIDIRLNILLGKTFLDISISHSYISFHLDILTIFSDHTFIRCF